jgi:hypothetical protein
VAVKQNGMKRTKHLSARGAKRQFDQLAVFFENILIRVDTVIIWLSFGIGGLTMAEYINRKALLQKAWDADTRIGYVRVVDVGDILDMPVADVAPVVHGRWMPFRSEAAGDIQYCSACEIGFDAKMAYCPHCGAKMDIKDGGDNDAVD